ncbi:hypothetical protein RN001_009336 [Aquatica leii]|uniref:Chromo domain-containing protein n=1 Tax=Aquatica leii TaxID=1421715 RepID=A0AAN7Q2E3_9COLE|nr:hypothetical protein RN001_009336 [Aquatica leii]
MTKKRSRKEKSKNAAEEENGVDSQDVKSDDESSLTEIEPKKRKSEKRKTSSPKKSKKSESTEKDEKEVEQETSEEENDTQYEVEEVIDEKMVKGVRHYLIRWKGYDQDGDTWEPESTLDCPELIKKFKEQKSNDENESPKKGRKSKVVDDDSETESPKKGKKETDKSGKKGKKDTKDKKTPKKPKTKGLPEVDWESDEEFEVDRILDVYFKKNGQREFLVSWKGYSSSQDSWEPEENLDCTNLIEKFMDKVQQAKSVEQKELRLNRTPTKRFTLNMYSGDGSRKLSRRLSKKQRVQYHDAE